MSWVRILSYPFYFYIKNNVYIIFYQLFYSQNLSWIKKALSKKALITFRTLKRQETTEIRTQDLPNLKILSPKQRRLCDSILRYNYKLVGSSCQFYQQFMSSFCANVHSQKNYKAKLYKEESCAKHFHTKKLLVK